MEGITVTLLDSVDSKEVATATTDAEGRYRIVAAPGTYAVKAVGNPHLIRVAPDEQVEVNLALPTN
jgi:hypothetical protein